MNPGTHTIKDDLVYGPYNFTEANRTYTVTSGETGLDLTFGCGSNSTSPGGKATFELHPSVLIGFYVLCSLGYLIIGGAFVSIPIWATEKLGFEKLEPGEGGSALAMKAFAAVLVKILSALIINVWLLPFTELAAVTQEGVLVGVFNVSHAYIIEIMFWLAVACPVIALGCVKCDTSRLNPIVVGFLPVGLFCASYILVIVSSASSQYTQLANYVPDCDATVAIAIVFAFNNIVISSSSPAQPAAISALSIVGLLDVILSGLASFVPE
jgi:hypothetical protein